MNYDVICDGQTVVRMSITQGEHAIVLDGKSEVQNTRTSRSGMQSMTTPLKRAPL